MHFDALKIRSIIGSIWGAETPNKPNFNSKYAQYTFINFAKLYQSYFLFQIIIINLKQRMCLHWLFITQHDTYVSL